MPQRKPVSIGQIKKVASGHLFAWEGGERPHSTVGIRAPFLGIIVMELARISDTAAGRRGNLLPHGCRERYTVPVSEQDIGRNSEYPLHGVVLSGGRLNQG